ncbi:hypothetical protein F2Q69_00042271 [Brassica cretica]|uniref:Uncharacterized protein n=1 Tax=Brassica cretica TaxID=69181 RepID=A0A8S9NML5_BRACR|nr:hypothetical protein F2Q69_00042271 [Brassica cretica]
MLPYQARVPRHCPTQRRANLSPESTLLVAYRVKGLVLVSEGKILRFELAELLGALLQLLGVFVELFLQDLEPRGKLGIGLFPSSMQPGYLTLQIVDLPLEFGFSMGSFGILPPSSKGLGSLYIVFLRRVLVGWSRLNSSTFGNMEGSPYRKFSISRRKGAILGPGPEKSIAENRGSF